MTPTDEQIEAACECYRRMNPNDSLMWDVARELLEAALSAAPAEPLDIGVVVEKLGGLHGALVLSSNYTPNETVEQFCKRFSDFDKIGSWLLSYANEGLAEKENAPVPLFTHPPSPAPAEPVAWPAWFDRKLEKLREQLGEGEFIAAMDGFELVHQVESCINTRQTIGRMACGDTAYTAPPIIAHLLNELFAGNLYTAPPASDVADVVEECARVADDLAEAAKQRLKHHLGGNDRVKSIQKAATEIASRIRELKEKDHG